MEINDFIDKIASQLEETDISKIMPQTKFRNEIEEWSSLTTFSIIAMVDAEYGVTIKGEEIRKCQTIEDIFNIVKAKK